jgi:hypothetical protein
MTNRHQAFKRSIDEINAPLDDWGSVQSRVPQAGPDPFNQPRAAWMHLQRMAVIALSLVIGFAALGFAFVALRTPSSNQAITDPPASLGSHPSSQAPPRISLEAGLPTSNSVADGRFVEPVALDGGTIRVDVAPPDLSPELSREEARQQAWSSPMISNTDSGSVLGFGLVTTTVSNDGVPIVSQMPAWIGFAWGGETYCGNIPVGTTLEPLPSSNGYVAIVVGVPEGQQPFMYSARSSTCGQPASGPLLQQAATIASVAWTTVGEVAHNQVNVAVDAPSCATRPTAVVDARDGVLTLEIDVIVPVLSSRSCSGATDSIQTVDLPQGWSGAASDVQHAPLGPVIQLRNG